VLADRKRDGVRGIRSETHRFKMHIQPAKFAGMDLDKAEPQHIAEWLREMSEKRAGDTRGDRLLEKSTIRRSQALVSAIFQEAVDRGLIKTNPAHGLRIKRKDGASATKDKWAWLTVEEQARLTRDEAISLEDRETIEFALVTGLRQGEQFNLEIRDLHVDDEDPRVVVRYGSPGLPPKSGKMREVPLFGDGLRVARACKERALANKKNPFGLVFPTANGKRRPIGKPLGRVRIDGAHVCTWKQALKLAGITRRFRWHDLRHTFASNLIQGLVGNKRRWSLEEVQPLMGHSSIVITQRYAHLGRNAIKRAVEETMMQETREDVAPPPSSLVRLVVARVLETLGRAS
jgi:integrase